MKIWRISNYADLSGMGGRYAAGRWNYKGRKIVYCADHPSTCILEFLVNIEMEALPVSYKLLEIQVSEVCSVFNSETLSPLWLIRKDYTRDVFEKFCTDNKAAILKVPCSITPFAHNFLINPEHPDIHHLKIASVFEHPFDIRLSR